MGKWNKLLAIYIQNINLIIIKTNSDMVSCTNEIFKTNNKTSSRTALTWRNFSACSKSSASLSLSRPGLYNKTRKVNTLKNNQYWKKEKLHTDNESWNPSSRLQASSRLMPTNAYSHVWIHWSSFNAWHKQW